MMELCHITFGYPGRELFRDFSLRVEPGERVILTGASGRGKTTLLRLMAGLEVPREGAVQGIPAGGISMVFQENRLFPGLTVRENLTVAVPGGSCWGCWRQWGWGGRRNGCPGSLAGGWPGGWRLFGRRLWGAAWRCWMSLLPGWMGRTGGGRRSC